MNLHSLTPSVLAVLLAWQIAPHPRADPSHLRYQRDLTMSTAVPPPGQTCAVLDASVFAHASPSLKDLRLYRGKEEVPYAVTLSEPLQQETEEARVLNLGTRSGHIVFDLEMPHRPYTEVTLDLAGQDFLAIAQVSGSDSPELASPTRLGTFTLFDLTSQHLSRSTSIPLPESTFRYLHVDLALTPAPGSPATAASLNQSAALKGATVPPSREAQTLFESLNQTASLVQRGRQTVAAFIVQQRVPIERIAFVLAPGYKGNFSRNVEVTAREIEAAGSPRTDATDTDPSSNESVTGTILRVHKVEDGREIADEQLNIPVAIGSNMQRNASIEVAIDNGDDAPLPITAVQLQMRQRRICFDAPAPDALPALYYGDFDLEAPVYDYTSLFRPVTMPRLAQLGPEIANPAFVSRDDTRPFTERHPELLWIALLGVVCILALTAIRSAKNLPR